jgi:beta-phosphoglucomutase-like phosphatase (HAD superfamily)
MKGRGSMKRKSALPSDRDIKGVILDIDGVLLDSLEIWKDLGRRYLKSRGIEAGEELEEVLETMSMEEGAGWLKKNYLPESTLSDILSGLEELLRDYYFFEVTDMPGAKDLLRALKDKGIRITAATLSPKHLVERALERNGLTGYIERIFTTGELGEGKNSSFIYDTAADFMGLERGEILVAEDSLYALETAAEAGYHTAWIRSGEDHEGGEKTAQICLEDLREALAPAGS